MRLKIFLILFLYFLINLSFVSAVLQVLPEDCDETGIFIVFRGAITDKYWGYHCNLVCGEPPSVCECETSGGVINGVLLKNQVIIPEELQKVTFGRVVESVGNPLVNLCKENRASVLERLNINDKGVITEGVLSISSSSNVEIGRMTDARSGDSAVDIALINFTAGNMTLYGSYWGGVEDPCQDYPFDWLKLEPTKQLTIEFKNEQDYVAGWLRRFVFWLRKEIPMMEEPKITAFSTCDPFDIYFQECTKFANRPIITPKTCPQKFAVVREGDARRILCSFTSFKIASYGGGYIGEKNCLDLVDGTIITPVLIEKDGKEEHIWVKVVETIEKNTYVNIETLKNTGKIDTKDIKATENQIISGSGDYIVKKTAEKKDIAPWTA